MEETRVSSWNALQDALFAEAWQADIQRYRSPYAFRGHQDAGQDLYTSLQRIGGEYWEMERHLLRNFRKYACRSDVETDSVWNWLSVAKHHGLPTRLLDWSFSPLVALHFATKDSEAFGRDGAVWMVNYKQVHQTLPQRLQDMLAEEGSDVFTVDMLLEAAQTLKDFDALAEEAFAVFFEPPALDERIANQFALFSILSNPRMQMNAWLDQHTQSVGKIILPAELKWEIRDKLDQANITERVLFPGLDGLSAWLKRQYSPKQ
jgi:hypothetical protein